MSLPSEFTRLAELMLDAASAIDQGVEGSFGDEEKQHPIAKDWRKVERRLRKEADLLQRMGLVRSKQ